MYTVLLVTNLVRGSSGASTKQNTIPIFSILSIAFHHDGCLNSITALLFNLISLKNLLTISRFSEVCLNDGGILKSQKSILSSILSNVFLNLYHISNAFSPFNLV